MKIWKNKVKPTKTSQIAANLLRTSSKWALVGLCVGLLSVFSARAVYAQQPGEGNAAETNSGEHQNAENSSSEGTGEPGAANDEHGEHREHPRPSINWTEFGRQVTDAHGEAKPQPPFLASVINFLILAFILYMVVTRMINPALKTRSESISAELEEAQQLLDEAKAAVGKAKEKQEKSSEEFKRIREEYVSSGQAEEKRLNKEAEAKSKRIEAEAALIADQEFVAMKQQLRQEVAQSALRLAEKLIENQLDQSDRSRLVGNYLTHLDSLAAKNQKVMEISQ